MSVESEYLRIKVHEKNYTITTDASMTPKPTLGFASMNGESTTYKSVVVD